MLAHFGRKLTIRHFVSRLQFYRKATNFLRFDVLAEFALGFTRTQDQQRAGTSNASKHLFINFLAVVQKLLLSPIVRDKIIRRVGVRRAWATRRSNGPSHA